MPADFHVTLVVPVPTAELKVTVQKFEGITDPQIKKIGIPVHRRAGVVTEKRAAQPDRQGRFTHVQIVIQFAAQAVMCKPERIPALQIGIERILVLANDEWSAAQFAISGSVKQIS